MREFCHSANRVLRLRSLCRATVVAIVAFTLPACSLSIPLAGLGPDDTPTGTIKSANASPFSAEMDGEDWRRAKSALETALDPQGNGARVTWENPQSGAKGTFVPLAQPFPKEDGICRLFAADLALKGRSESHLRSTACRKNSGEWIVGKITAFEEQAAASKASYNLAERDTRTQLH